MGLLSSSKSSTDTRLNDYSANAAAEGSSANFLNMAKNNISGSISVNDPQTALAAISSNERTITQLSKDAKDNLTSTQDVFKDLYTKALSAAQSIADDANNQVNSTRDFAEKVIGKEQETGDDRVMKTIMIAAAAVLGGIWLLTQGGK